MNSYPNIYVLLEILGTVALTSCECERSGSALKRLNTYLRASRGQNRLNPLGLMHINLDVDFFFIWVFFHNHSRITGLQGKGEGISLTPHYHFHPLQRYLDISWAITAESSSLHIGSSRTRIGSLCFPSASRYPLS